ncbi:winged helix-turn-helix domain-containing protein [Vannielia litorea]|uniref:winged helix-turn-helix domain-containing protein n=1 Tax=Vannielia litorea TaxID=1217970 RepID=UPI001BD1410E|nr:winged helix-turn-helix domain-containing protein [Vannielia litorea]
MTRAAHRGKTVSNAAFARLWNNHDMTLAEIGAELGISAQAVRFRAAARDLPPRPQFPRDRQQCIGPEQEDSFRSMWRYEVGCSDMAAHFGTNMARICKTAERLGLPKRSISRWNKINTGEWREQRLAGKLAASAAQTRAAIKDADMKDIIIGRRAAR